MTQCRKKTKTWQHNNTQKIQNVHLMLTRWYFHLKAGLHLLLLITQMWTNGPSTDGQQSPHVCAVTAERTGSLFFFVWYDGCHRDEGRKEGRLHPRGLWPNFGSNDVWPHWLLLLRSTHPSCSRPPPWRSNQSPPERWMGSELWTQRPSGDDI